MTTNFLRRCCFAPDLGQHLPWLQVQVSYLPVREPFKNYLADFFRYGGTPPYPLIENHFAKKPLAERGGTPPPSLNEKSPKKF